MSLRLLSFLSLIQQRLERAAPAGTGEGPVRSVNYEQGLGRLQFQDGGSITLHVQGVAHPQGCIKGVLGWSGSAERVTRVFFPGPGGHDWTAAAEELAVAWLAGPGTSAQPIRAVNRVEPQLVRRETAANTGAAVAV
jgi:hypothetical protein